MPGSQFFPVASTASAGGASTQSNAFIAATPAEMLSGTNVDNDICFRSDTNEVYVLIDRPSSIASNWKKITDPAAAQALTAATAAQAAATAAAAAAAANTTVDFWLDRGMPNAAMTLSGTAAFSAAREFSWTNRFIIYGGSQGGWSTVGYYDITMPPAGTVINSLSSTISNITVTAAGIPFPLNWCALYYKMNAGVSTSVAGNFFVASFSGNVAIPNNCVLVATYNRDNNTIKLGDGKILTSNATYDPSIASAAPAQSRQITFAKKRIGSPSGQNFANGVEADVILLNNTTIGTAFGTWSAAGVFTFTTAGTYSIDWQHGMFLTNSNNSTGFTVSTQTTMFSSSSGEIDGQSNSVVSATTTATMQNKFSGKTIKTFVVGETLTMKAKASASVTIATSFASQSVGFGIPPHLAEIIIEKIA
jgi:hypothetical protein